MPYQPRILAFAGSAREDSFNKKLVKIAAAGARKAGAEVTYLDLRDLPMPLFDQDLEAREGEHPNAKKFKDLLRAHDGFLIATPENNSAMSALLKNAIDWASRRKPNEKPLECFANKLVVLMSASPSERGGLRGLLSTATLMRNIRCIVLPDQVGIPHADKAFNEDGSLKEAKQQESVEQLGAVLAQALAKFKS